MTTRLSLLALAALAVAACAGNDMATPFPTGGGSVGAEGPGYCDSPPADPAELEAWEQQCMPDRR